MWSEGELHVCGSERGSGLSRSCFSVFVVGDTLLEGSSLLSTWRRVGAGAADERARCCPCALPVRPVRETRWPPASASWEAGCGFSGTPTQCDLWNEIRSLDSGFFLPL